MCFCVDTTTGQRLNGMFKPHMVPAEERETLNCTEGELHHVLCQFCGAVTAKLDCMHEGAMHEGAMHMYYAVAHIYYSLCAQK